jgi:hypothetical protein
MKRPRDSQQRKFYAAKERAFPAEGEVMTPKACEAFVTKCLKSKRLGKLFPKETVKGIKFKTRRSGYSWGPNGMAVGKAYHNKPTLLKILANIIHWRTESGSREAWHGREFCQVYLAVVKVFQGADAARTLKLAFREEKVKHTKKRPLSAALRAHNEAMKMLLNAAAFQAGESK